MLGSVTLPGGATPSPSVLLTRVGVACPDAAVEVVPGDGVEAGAPIVAVGVAVLTGACGVAVGVGVSVGAGVALGRGPGTAPIIR